MYRHGATGLAGPVSKARVWWICPAAAAETTNDLTIATSPTVAAVPEEDIRHDLVARVRREIAEGTYETPDKWETAIARLVNRL